MRSPRGDGLYTTTVVVLVVLLCLQGAALGAVPRREDDDDPSRTYHISMDDDPERLKHVANIVDSLELLGILGADSGNQAATAATSAPTSCYTVDRIVKTREPSTEGGARSWKIGIFLYVNEMTPSMQTSSSSSRCGTSSPVTADSYLSNSGVRHAAADNDTSLSNSTELDSVGPEDAAQSTQAEDNLSVSESTLSRTQITVIAACSIVIGLFFIVALSLRIRNYIRRYKRSEQLSRSSFHSSNVSMRHSHYYEGREGREGRTEMPRFKIAGHSIP